MRLGGLPKFEQSEIQRCRKHELESFKSIYLVSHSKWLRSKNDGPYPPCWDEQIISERKRMPYTLYNNNNMIDELSNFRDKYLKKYRVKNTNISILTPAFCVTCIGNIFVHLSTCHLSTCFVTWPTSFTIELDF